MKKRITYKTTILLILTACFTIAVSSVFVKSEALAQDLRILSMLIWFTGFCFMSMTEHIWKK